MDFILVLTTIMIACIVINAAINNHLGTLKLKNNVETERGTYCLHTGLCLEYRTGNPNLPRYKGPPPPPPPKKNKILRLALEGDINIASYCEKLELKQGQTIVVTDRDTGELIEYLYMANDNGGSASMYYKITEIKPHPRHKPSIPKMDL